MATDTLPSAPRPPGSAGLPGIGETLAFVKDPFTFIQARRARYGRVFRTSLLGRSTAVLIGPEPLEAFYDPANVVREGANPANIQTLFGGTGVINGLDGEAHASRKQFVSAALVKRCELVAAAFIVADPLPGTAYTKGVRAKDESIAYYRELVRAHRAGSYDDVRGDDRAPDAPSRRARAADRRNGGAARCAEQRAHPYAYAPQGAGPPETHRCPGFDLTTVFMALFAARLARGYDWTLPEQDLTPNWALIPPVPRDGLRATVRSR